MNYLKRLFPLVLACSLLMGCGSNGDSQQSSSESEENSVTMLTISTEPDKVVYEAGEMFDATGIVIDATLSDGTVEKNVDYNCKQKDPLETTDTAVTFTYGGKTVIQKITVEPLGNNEKYSVDNFETLSDSPLADKTYLWLGSSVTEGYGSMGESMVDYIAKKYSANCVKEAVSGTTLADSEESSNVGDSYVKRLDAYLESDDAAESLDAFICQLSTNDANGTVELGAITDASVKDVATFDTQTTYGAMEYIIATVREKYNCPVIFYTNSNYNNATYEEMVAGLHELEDKWGITVIDLFTDEEFNNVSDEELELYMKDSVHPTRAGYFIWWLPKFEDVLLSL